MSRQKYFKIREHCACYSRRVVESRELIGGEGDAQQQDAAVDERDMLVMARLRTDSTDSFFCSSSNLI